MLKGILAATAAVAIVCMGAVVAPDAVAERAVDRPGAVNTAYYSSGYSAPQSKSPASMRKYLSTMHPAYDLQSYVFYGSLVEPSGRTSTFSLMMQQSNRVVAEAPTISFAVEGVMFNGGGGFTVGGVQGVPELTVPLSLTARPWSARAEAFTLGQQPQFVDARVIEGRMGERGAVYEFTSNVPGRDVDTNKTYPFSVYVRVKDLTGIVQWGYGPSGFFPQWIYGPQRDSIMTKYGGSVERYLSGTQNPLKGQGDYYYSSPLLEVQRFIVSENDKVVSHGRAGTIWFDTVTQSYGPKAKAIIDNGVQWLEFSLQLPDTEQALKIGRVTQKSVGSLPYAMMMDGDGEKRRNGAIVPSSRWNIGDIKIDPVRGSIWTSPKTGERYYMKYHVKLNDEDPGKRADLVLTARFDNQEVVLSQARTVYEGLFDFTGTINGERVSGSGWGEIQPSNSL